MTFFSQKTRVGHGEKVDEGFRAFHGTLMPTQGESQAAKSQRASIEAYLVESFESNRFFPTGSFGNGTSIRGHSDRDYFACIPTKNLKRNLFTTLQEVQKALGARFPKRKISLREPAVVVHFGNNPSESTEIVPADFITRDKDGNHIYEIANGDGGWMRSSPDAHNNYVDEVDRKFDGNGEVKRLVRFLKAWKYYCGVPIKSFYLELFVTRYASQKSSITYSKDVRNILACLWNEQLAALKDPKGISGRVPSCSSEAQKVDALSKLGTAFERAEEAREAEKTGEIQDAFRQWNLVFARKFPSYDQLLCGH